MIAAIVAHLFARKSIVELVIILSLSQLVAHRNQSRWL